MSSPFQQAATLMDTVASHAALLTTTRLHPGSGDVAERADALAQTSAQRAIQVEDWLTETAKLCESQAAADDILSAAPKPADLEAWHEQWSALPEGELKEAERKEWLTAAAKRAEALREHTASTITEVPALPESCTVPVDSFGGEGSPTESPEKDSADGDRLGDEEGTAPESGSPDNETPVTMSTGVPEAPVTMSTGTRETPVTMSDSAANTELSSSALTSDPAARAALSQPMGQGAPQVSAAGQSPAMGGAPGVSQQLSQPARGGGGGGTGTAPRSPEKRREEQDKQAEKDATVQAASSVTLAGTAGAVAAASMASAPSSPGTATSGASAAPATPASANTAPANPAQGGAPVGGAGMGGMRSGSLGSGSTVKPVISTEQPPTPTLTPEEQRLLDEYDKKDGKK